MDISLLPPDWAALVGDLIVLTTALRTVAVLAQKWAKRTASTADDQAVGKFTRVLDLIERLLDITSVGPTKRKR